MDVTAARHGGRDSEQWKTLKGFIHADARGWELVEWNAGDVIEVPAGTLPATWCIADSWQVRRNTNGEGWQVTQTHGWGAATEQYELSWICGKHAALWTEEDWRTETSPAGLDGIMAIQKERDLEWGDLTGPMTQQEEKRLISQNLDK